MSQDGFLGEIKMFAGNFPPRSWAFCDGRLMAIPQNTALFSILGTTYGGDGRTTFALPDLRGRAAIGAGNGPGLTDRKLGSRTGTENNNLTTWNLPAHHHNLINDITNGAVVSVSKPTATASAISTVTKADLIVGKEGMGQTPEDTPDDNYLGKSLNSSNIYRPNPGTASIEGVDIEVDTTAIVDVAAPTAIISGKTTNTGGSQAVNNMQPSLAVYYIICIEGTYPSRS